MLPLESLGNDFNSSLNFWSIGEQGDGGNVWLYKWGDFEDNLNSKISPGGFGGESIEKTLDNGFIISTGGGTVLKTDSHLSY